MPAATFRIPFPPAVLVTLLATAIMLSVVYLIAPEIVQKAVLVVAALMVVALAFTSVELTLYLLILSTLLGPEAIVGGAPSGRTGTTESRGVTLRLDDILMLLIGFTWLFRMALTKELGRLKTPINQPVIVYLIMTLLATMVGYAAGRVEPFGFFFVLKYFQYFVLFYMIVGHVEDEAAIKRYLGMMVFTCFAASLYGLAQIPGGGRVSAPFEGETLEPNTFGGYLLLMFSVVLGMLLHIERGRTRLILIMMIPLILVTLAFTESRSSYLGITAATILFFIFSERKQLLVLGALAAMALFPVVIPQNVIDRVFYTFTQPVQQGQLKIGGVRLDTSTSARIESWKRAIERNFVRSPILGVGVTGGGFMDAQYPRVLAETGALGFLAFAWLLRRIWVTLRRSYYALTDPVLRGAALGTLCGFGGLLVHAVGTNTFIIVRIMEPLMILVGLILAAYMLQQSREMETVAPPPERAKFARRLV